MKVLKTKEIWDLVRKNGVIQGVFHRLIDFPTVFTEPKVSCVVVTEKISKDFVRNPPINYFSENSKIRLC